MTILAANLKHLYQRRGLWFVYGLILLLALVSLMELIMQTGQDKTGQGKFVGPVILASVIGLVVSGMQIEIITRPFSYCMPRHHGMMKKVVFLVGISVNIIFCLIFLLYPAGSFRQYFIIICSAFSAGWICYLLGAVFGIVIRNNVILVSFLPLIIIGGRFFDFHLILEERITDYPYYMIISGLLSGFIMWVWLSDMSLIRRLCGTLRISVADSFNYNRMVQYSRAFSDKQWDIDTADFTGLLERYFLKRIKKEHVFSTARCVWSSINAMYGMISVHNKRVFQVSVAWFLIVIWFCYFGTPAARMLWAFSTLLAACLRLPVFSNMLIFGGRKERFITNWILTASNVIFTVLIMTAISLWSKRVVLIMPEFTVKGQTFSFSPVHLSLFYIPLIWAPVFYTFQLIFYRKSIYLAVSLVMVFMMMIFITAVWPQHVGPLNTWLIVLSVIATWTIFTSVLWFICKKLCLVY